MNIQNAKITSTQITMKDHGCLTFWINLEGAGWGVEFGGFCIGKGYKGAKEFSAKNGYGLEAIMRIMDVVGVDTWEDMKGKYIRAELEGWGGGCYKIGNLIEDKWFNIKKFFNERQQEDE